MTSPQDPYRSCIVNAAAGAGKTWQLSRRFLFLVGAHAQPHEILTITFTRKAAAEMRARVISSAAELAIDGCAQQEFDSDLRGYHENFQPTTALRLRPPLSAAQVGNAILSQSQKLKIATIDSVCSEWLASLAGQGFADIPMPFSIITDADVSDLQERSWQQLWQTLPASLREIVREEGTAAVSRKVMALHNLGRSRRRALHVPEARAWEDIAAQLAALSPAFAHCAAAASEAQLQQLGMFKRKKINRALLNAQQKKLLRTQLQALDQEIKARRRADSLQRLNARGAIYFKIWQRWQDIYGELKKTRSALDFQDLAGMVQALLSRDQGLMFYLQQRIAHLLLDEFQDTSAQQWHIFRQLSYELLAGDNCVAARQGLQATVFIVGDPKQSIYAFRAADAKIMASAAEDLEKFSPHQYPLAVNYRSAAHLLKFYNVVFPGLALPDFHLHQPATGAPQVKDYGTVTLAPLTTTEVEEEARYVARHVAQVLQEKQHLTAGDICILYRNKTHAEVFRDALAREGLSSMRHEEQGFFTMQTSQDLLALCKWLALPQDQQALMTVLVSPLCGIPTQALLQVYGAEQARGHAYRRADILQALAQSYPQQVQTLRELQARKYRDTPCRILLYALQNLGALHRHRQHGSEFMAQQAQQNISKYIDLLAAAEREGCNTLAALHVRLSAQAQHDSVGSAAARADAVTMMTIHKAKGLQFKHVILVQAQEQWTKRDRYWLKVDDCVVYSGKACERPQDSELDQLYAARDEEDNAEALRLLYVALTRAEHYLLVCGKSAKTAKQQGGFLGRIVTAVKASNLSWHSEPTEAGEIVTLHGSNQPPERAAQPATPQFRWSTIRRHSHSLAREVKILLPHQKRSAATAREEHHPASLVYGTYLHKALEQHVKKAVLPTRRDWDKLATGLGKESTRMWQEAEQTLHKLLSSPVWQGLWREALWSKAEMSVVCLNNGSLINGVVDLLICYPDQQLKIIDYKTGTVPAELSTYQQQLHTYRIAVQKLYPDHCVATALLFTSDCHLVPV